MTDNRAFGYVYGGGDGRHDFFGIKTEKAVRVFYDVNFNRNNMFASLHALKWADFAAKFSNLIIISIHVTVSKCNLISILMVISVHLGQITI